MKYGSLVTFFQLFREDLPVTPVTNTLFIQVHFAVFSCCFYYMILCYAYLIVLIEYINNRRTLLLFVLTDFYVVYFCSISEGIMSEYAIVDNKTDNILTKRQVFVAEERTFLNSLVFETLFEGIWEL
jgi:hypothetical protein